MSAPRGITATALLYCECCHGWHWHSFAECRDLGHMLLPDKRGARQPLGFELMFRCADCDTERRWGIVTQRPVQP